MADPRYAASRLARRLRGAPNLQSVRSKHALTQFLLSKPKTECVASLERILRAAWVYRAADLDGPLIQSGLDALLGFGHPQRANTSGRDIKSRMLAARPRDPDDYQVFIFYNAVVCALDVAFPELPFLVPLENAVCTVISGSMGWTQLPEDEALDWAKIALCR